MRLIKRGPLRRAPKKDSSGDHNHALPRQMVVLSKRNVSEALYWLYCLLVAVKSSKFRVVKILSDNCIFYFSSSNVGLPSSQEDQFNESMVSRNLSPIRARNAVHRNDSYCVAINKSQTPGSPFYSPFRQRPVHRPSPLAMANDRVPPLATSSPARTSTPMDGRSENGIESGANVLTGRPISTIAIPTPPLESTDEKPSSPSQAPVKPLAPQPPPRWDSEVDPSANNNYNLQARLKLRLKMPDAERPQEEGTNSKPPSPPSQFSNQSPSQECPPSYDQAVARLGRSPHASVSSEHATPREQRKSLTEENAENSIIAPPSPFSTEENPFQRDGFGRTSMSEKRGRATLDARQSEFFVKREQDRNEGR